MGFLVPGCGPEALRRSVRVAIMGALLGGLYGILHDQVTYTLSNEYFTRLKFEQFGFQDSSLHPRLLVTLIGLMATWWVGLIAGWFIGRMGAGPNGQQLPMRCYAEVALALIGVIILSGLLGYLFGVLFYDVRKEHWEWAEPLYAVQDVESFARVGYIHNFVYVGGVLGTMICMIWTRRRVKSM